MIRYRYNTGISILGILFLGIIIVLVLSYYKISIRSIIESPVGQENINYVGEGAKNLWVDYLKEPTLYIWNEIFLKIVWESFIENVGKTTFLK